MTWLQSAPRIKLPSDTNKRKPYPLSWKEQAILFEALADHLAAMALFAVNNGCKDSEVCNLQWSWKVDVPQLDTAVFIIPGEQVKNGDDRLVVRTSVTLALSKRENSQASQQRLSPGILLTLS